MTERPRDWDKELSEIDRAIDKGGAPPGAPGPSPTLPPRPSGAPVGPPAAGAPVAGPPPVAKGSVAKTWFLVSLAVLLAAALPLWPYGKECGLQLFFYLGAAALALLAALAGAVSSWASRRALAHTISLFVVVWVGVLGAREVLPRVGYAGETKPWLCPTTPEPVSPAGGTQPAPVAP